MFASHFTPDGASKHEENSVAKIEVGVLLSIVKDSSSFARLIVSPSPCVRES